MTGGVDVDLIRKLADLLDETGLAEIEYEDQGRRVRVSRAAAAAAAPAIAAPAVPTPETVPEEAPGSTAGLTITSPMVGTVYLAPEPGAVPFVKEGAAVSEGQTIMLIEAMKTYNPVRAPRDGTVARILVGDATPVEFGEELMIIE